MSDAAPPPVSDQAAATPAAQVAANGGPDSHAARLMLSIIQDLKWDNEDTFLGHVGGDDFIFIGREEQTEMFAKMLTTRLDQTILKFYDQKTKNRGYVLGRDRQGRTTTFPLVSVSIAVVVNCQGIKFNHVGEIAAAGAEIKAYLKRIAGSAYLVDRRESC